MDNSNATGINNSFNPPLFNFTYNSDSNNNGDMRDFNTNIFNNNNNKSSNNITTNFPSIKTSLWEVSASSVIIIPLNSFLIALGLRMLFCKMKLEIMKFSLIAILFLLYITSMIGLTLYSSQGNSDLFK